VGLGDLAQYDQFARTKHRAISLLRTMSCPEYNRLRQHYEAAIRHWGRVILSPDDNLVGALARQAAEIRQKAYVERDAAKKRLSDHGFACPVCNPKRRAARRSVD
jgi:hypothetical protein